jgi:hypothetical protein
LKGHVHVESQWSASGGMLCTVDDITTPRPSKLALRVINFENL